MQTIAQYAARHGVSERAVRARVERGTLRAVRVGTQWVIDDDSLQAPRRAGRPLSARSFDQLADFLEGSTVDMTPVQKHRAKVRAEALRTGSLEDLQRLALRPEMTVLHLVLDTADLADLAADPRLRLTGVAHPGAEIYGPLVDAYVSPQELRRVRLEYGLAEAPRPGSTVRLRTIDPPPEVRTLHVAADLLDDRTARARTEARRQLDRALGRV